MVRLESCFFVVGVPGILLALVFQLTVKEPPRGYSENIGTPVTPPASVGGQIHVGIQTAPSYRDCRIAHCFHRVRIRYLDPHLSRAHS